METRSECNKVRSMIELFESRCRKENAIRLNKPLSKSFSALSHSEKKYRSNFYGNHDTIYKVEDKLAFCTSEIKTYGIYSKETHIKHLQELLQIFITLVNLDTGDSEAIVAKKKEIVNCIVTRFEELNHKLPSTLSNENFDFTYKTYSSLISPDFQDRKNEDTESIVAVVGSAVGSIERLESSSCNSSNDNEDRKSPDIIVENGTILGSVEKLKAIFSSNTILRKQQVTENYSRKARVDNGLNTYDSVAKNTVFDNYQTEIKMSLTTVVTESTETERADEYEGSLVTDDSSFHKNFDNGDFKNYKIQDQTEEHEKEDEETSDTEELCLSSKSLNEISRNRDGMETVSSLKKIFEGKDAQNTLDNQKSTEDEVVVPESLVVHVELLDKSEISITLDKDRVDVSHSEVEVLGVADEALADTLIELGGGDEEECNVTVLREHPEYDKSDTSSTKSDRDLHSEVEVLVLAEEALEDTLIELGGGDEEECNVTVLREHPEDDKSYTSSTKSDRDLHSEVEVLGVSEKALEDTLIELGGGDEQECNVTVLREHPEDDKSYTSSTKSDRDLHSEVEVLGVSEKALEDTLIELGGGDEQECNVTVLQEHPEDDKSDTSSTKSDKEACIIS